MDKHKIESRNPVVFIYSPYPLNNQRILIPYGKGLLTADKYITFV
jgi:hypothetical protein